MEAHKRSQIINKFMSALQETEQQRAPEKVAALFKPGSKLQNLMQHSNSHQNTEPVDFWSHYLQAFHEVQTEFTNQLICGSTAVLEWTSSGRLKNHSPFEYNGVSFIELEGDGIIGFRTYYDSAAFIRVPSYLPIVEENNKQAFRQNITNLYSPY